MQRALFQRFAQWSAAGKQMLLPDVLVQACRTQASRQRLGNGLPTEQVHSVLYLDRLAVASPTITRR